MSGTTNLEMKQLLTELKTQSIKGNVKLWKRLAEDLEKSNRDRRVVNISRINHFTKEGEMIVVPGKVLGTGALNHKLTIAAYSFSNSALREIEKVKGKAITITQLLKEKPDGKGIRIIG